jgi:hypothetical protein
VQILLHKAGVKESPLLLCSGMFLNSKIAQKTCDADANFSHYCPLFDECEIGSRNAILIAIPFRRFQKQFCP